MSTEQDSNPDAAALADAIKDDPEAREQLADAIVNQMQVDTDTPEGEAAQSYRRDVLKALGAVGTGAVLGGGASRALSEPAAASHGGGTIGTASDPLEMVHTEGVSSLDSLSVERLYSDSRLPTHVIRDTGSGHAVDGPDGTFGEFSNAAAAFDEALKECRDASPQGGVIHFARGVFNWESTAGSGIDWPSSVIVSGVSPSATRLKVDAALTAAFDVSRSGATIPQAPTFRDFSIQTGTGSLTYGFDIDSSRHGGVRNIRLVGDATLVHAEVNETTQNAEHWDVIHCRGQSGGQIAHLEAGSEGRTDGFFFRHCHSFSLTGWAFNLEDGTDHRLEKVGAYNNGDQFDGCVRIANPDAADGSGDVRKHSVDGVMVENIVGTPTAVGVKVEAPSGAESQQRFHEIRRVGVTPANECTSVEFSHPASTAGRIKLCSFEEFKILPTHSEGIVVDSGVRDCLLRSNLSGFGVSDLRGITDDNGDATQYNDNVYQSLGGSAPDATNWAVGVTVHDTDNPGTAYLVYDAGTSGGVTQIGA